MFYRINTLVLNNIQKIICNYNGAFISFAGKKLFMETAQLSVVKKIAPVEVYCLLPPVSGWAAADKKVFLWGKFSVFYNDNGNFVPVIKFDFNIPCARLAGDFEIMLDRFAVGIEFGNIRLLLPLDGVYS